MWTWEWICETQIVQQLHLTKGSDVEVVETYGHKADYEHHGKRNRVSHNDNSERFDVSYVIDRIGVTKPDELFSGRQAFSGLSESGVRDGGHSRIFSLIIVMIRVLQALAI